MNRKSWISALILSVALFACGGKPAEQTEPAAEATGSEQPAPAPMAEMPAEPAPEAASAPAAEPAPPAENTLPVVTALVIHKVKDYDAWKKGFDEHQPARQEAGIVAHHVSRGVDDPSLVAVYLVGTDKDKLVAMTKSADLKAAMKAAGVKGKPTINILTPVENKMSNEPTLFGAIVKHEVKDFDAWKPLFDEDASARASAGVVGTAVSRDADKPNLVVLYVQASAAEPLKAFGNSKELKEKMKGAGVKGKPEMTFVQGVEWVQYK